jgi:cysteine synthase A
MERRKSENELALPFLRVNIKERFSLFEGIFSDCGVSKEDMELVEKRFKELTKELHAYPVNQFNNEDNAWAHYYSTGEEIINDLKDVDVFVDYVGTGGSFVGVGKRLKDDHDCLCYKVVPSEKEHSIQGGGYFKDIPFEEDNLCDGEIEVSSEEAIEGMKELAQIEGIYGGISSGANLKAALKVLQEKPNKKIVFLINDVGLKYLSVN